MVQLTPVQTLGLVCLIAFSLFVIIVLFLECIGRFHCLVRITKAASQPSNNDNDEHCVETSKKRATKCMNSVSISSGFALQCFDKLNCYCCWRDDGIEQSVVIALPKSKNISSSCCSELRDKTCAICLDELNTLDQRKLIELECGHDFHTSCIMKWLKQADKCPLCKGTLNIEVISEPSMTDSCDNIVFTELGILESASHV